MSSVYSIFIPVAVKDYKKLNYLLESVRRNLIGYDEVIIVSPDGDGGSYISVENKRGLPKIISLKDRDVIDIDKFECKYRPGWTFQMFLKMFQQVTSNDMYLTIDSDLVFNKPLHLFEDNKPIMYRGTAQYHIPYFVFQEKLFDLPRVFPHTFICDMNFYSKTINKEFLDRYDYTIESFWKKTCEINSPQCRLGEPELIGQYVYKFHKDEFVYKSLTMFSDGKTVQDPNHHVWSDREIKEFIEKGRRSGADLTTFHSWFGV